MDQNQNGSWGSAARTKDLNIIAGIGSHHAFRTAVTALCVSALIEVADLSQPAVREAIERGEAFLFEQLSEVRRDEPMLIYNVWTHAYGIQALVDMYGRLPDDVARREKIVGLIREQFDKLGKYESAEGGWGYYDFTAGTQRPASSSTSFVNAAVLVAFDHAKRIGVEPPAKLVDRALKMIQFQRKPDNTYIYGTYLRNNPMMPVNRPGGSLGRGYCLLRVARPADQPKWMAGYGAEATNSARIAFSGGRLFLLLWPLLCRTDHPSSSGRKAAVLSGSSRGNLAGPSGKGWIVVGLSSLQLSPAVWYRVFTDVFTSLP